MTSTVHRILMAVGGIASALGGVTGGSDLIDPQLGAWIAFIGGVAIIVANQLRVAFPDKPAAIDGFTASTKP